MEDKKLYKPFRSKLKDKKYSVYVMKNGKKKLIHFGQRGYPDWRSRSASPAQRKSYLARAKGITDKSGKKTYLDKNTANYWSVTYLW